MSSSLSVINVNKIEFLLLYLLLKWQIVKFTDTKLRPFGHVIIGNYIFYLVKAEIKYMNYDKDDIKS